MKSFSDDLPQKSRSAHAVGTPPIAPTTSQEPAQHPGPIPLPTSLPVPSPMLSPSLTPSPLTSQSSLSSLSPATALTPVFRVAITGGPCAGKTTALTEVAERLRTRGFGVFVVPEAATLMFTGGVTPMNNTPAQTLNLQTQLLRTQIALEDAFTKVARGYPRPAFILCDRGTCDGRAYMPDEMWRTMLRRNHWDMVSIRDARYDLVVHLVTAADGAPRFYTLDNNQARSESPQEARRVDARTQKAWVGHPQLRIVDNRSAFREKIDRVFSHIIALAGDMPMPSRGVADVSPAKDPYLARIVRKFLLRLPASPRASMDANDDDDYRSPFGVANGGGSDGWPIHATKQATKRPMKTASSNALFRYNICGQPQDQRPQQHQQRRRGRGPPPPPPPSPPGGEEFLVEQTVLRSELGDGDGVQESVRRRGKGDGEASTFVHKVRSGARETKRQITNREYLSLLAHADSERRTVRIRRQCFLHRGTYFVLDCVTNVDPGVWLLRCHCESSEERVEIPEWLTVEREVTGDPEYTMHSLSKHVLPERARDEVNPIKRDDNIGLDITDLARSL